MVPVATGSCGPVVYAGRLFDRLAGGLPGVHRVLDEWDVLPRRLAAVMREATTLVVADPLSFPFETATGEGWDTPLVVVLPLGFDAEDLVALFGPALFERLGFFDRVATHDDDLWERLSRRYRWAQGQRVRVRSDSPWEAAAEVCAALAEEPAVPNVLRDRYEADRYWDARDDAANLRTPRSVHHSLGFDKAVHAAQAAVLEPQFVAARAERAPSVPLDVLEVGAGAGRWVRSFDPAGTRYVGAEADGNLVDASRLNFPGTRFDRLPRGPARLPYEDESFDMVFGVTTMRHSPPPERRAMLSEMWRVARPGGRLTVLEEFVAGGGRPASRVPVPTTISVTEFVGVVLEATAGQVTLEHVESLRYPHDDLQGSAVISLSKLGVPTQW